METATATRSTKKRSTAAAVTAGKVSVWMDDPASALGLVERPVPVLSKGPLKFRIKGAAPKPGIYPKGTAQFRYWAAAEPLRRGGDFWSQFGITKWQLGATLPVSLDKGVDLNAYYDRSELAFFHEKVGGTTYYSGESPDVVCHEMGHATLDAHRPELWDAPFIEAGAFHESFGDMSAILSALTLKEVRTQVVASVSSCRSNDLSRCAEQLGEAIRQVAPDAAEKKALRDAYNSFKYVDPQTLPDDAPATRLSAEVHSFSRVFTGAFYEILCGMLNARAKKPKEGDLAAAAADLAQLLVDATGAAPVQPDYYAQVAAHMVDADATRFAGRYRDVLTQTFVSRLLLPKAAVQPLEGTKRAAARAVAATMSAAKPETRTRKCVIPAQEFGLGDEKLIVVAPVERNAFRSAAAGLAHRFEPSVEEAAYRFLKMLFAHNRVDTESRQKRMPVTDETPRERLRKTHVLTQTAEGLRLSRRLFHCGCAVPCRHGAAGLEWRE
ncbi:MAG TPA: hypothetical protein VFP36_00595 [Usitatibacter sp.]|nr:hypothetical protein [Usitatibacter sp.]